jgi:hypothetical protein
MSDEVDVSNDRWDLFVSMRITNAQRYPAEAEATGECLFCGEELPEHRRWCDADCRDGWQKLEGQK